MKKLIPILALFVLLMGGTACAQTSYQNIQFDPTTGQVQQPTTTPYPTVYPTTLALMGISDPLIVLTSGSYGNPSWITGLGWSKITGTPTSLAGYGITDPVALTSGSYSNPAWITALAWSKITGAPTSAAGYGIVNGANIDSVGTLGGAAYYTNAGNLSAGTLLAARFPAFTGDATTSAGGVAITLATVNANVGTFGSSTQNAQITVNAKGLITAVSLITESNPWSSITGTPTTLAGYGITDGVNTVTNDTNVTGVASGHTLTLGWTGTLAAARLNAATPQSITNDTNVTGSISAQVLTLGWTGTLAAGRLNANVVQGVTNDTNITGSISGQNLTFAWASTLAAARLNANVVQSIVNGTNVTGSITAQSLTLGWTGQLAIASGGTGASTAANAYNALSPTTTLGDVAYANGTGTNTRLAGNTSATRQFLGQTGNGTISAAPAWTALATSDIPTISLSTGVNGALQAAQEPAHTGDATNSAGSLAMTVVKINGTSLAGLTTGILKNTTATGVPTIAVSGTDYLGTTGGATITTVGTLTAGTWNATVVGILYGGSGQTTAAAAFNAFSPLTTAGDLIYEVSAGVAGRIAVGANPNGYVLTLVSGAPAWAASAGGGGSVGISGTPSANQLAVWASGTTIQGITALPAANVPAFTGDMTTTAGSLATTVKGINGTLLSGLSTGIVKNTTTTGVPSIAVAGTDYIAPFGSQTANFVYASPSGSSGVPSFRALAALDIPTISAASQLSGTLAQAQFPAMTGDVTNSAGSLSTTVGKIGGQAVSLGGALTMSGAFGFTGTVTGTTAVTFPTSGTLLSTTTGVSSLTGTANQITVSAATGAITVSLPTVLTLPGTMSTIGSQTANINAITNSSTDGQVLLNGTAAVSGTQLQWSPRLRWTGFGWKRNTSTSLEQDFIEENQISNTSTTVISTLTISFQSAGGGYTSIWTLTNAGVMTVGGGITDNGALTANLGLIVNGTLSTDQGISNNTNVVGDTTQTASNYYSAGNVTYNANSAYAAGAIIGGGAFNGQINTGGFGSLTYYGLEISPPANVVGGGSGNAYGLYMAANPALGGLNYSIYSADSAATAFLAGSEIVNGATASSSTITGSFQVVGGVGIGGALYTGGGHYNIATSNTAFVGGLFQNSNAGTSTVSRVTNTNGTHSTYWETTGTAFAGVRWTNGFTGEAAYFVTDNTPLGLGTASKVAIAIDTSQNIVTYGNETVADAVLRRTSAALTNSAALATPTLGTTAPTGSTTPRKWVQVVDSSGTYYSPMW